MSVRYQSAIDDGLTEDAVCCLEQPSDADDLSPAERSAVRFADLFATDHLSIDDSVYDGMRRYFTEDELVELGVHCAYAVGIGMGRLTATWDMTDDLPDAFRSPSNSPLAPWISDGVVASGSSSGGSPSSNADLDWRRWRRAASASTRVRTGWARRGECARGARHSGGSGCHPSMLPSTNSIC
jgi:hypothetical protein